ncbi:MAG TPA: hypothetical protein VFS00_11360 [Polyangiaceae bacterium]|nr:hypothetical protein [Polyangiaceae bacterium]
MSSLGQPSTTRSRVVVTSRRSSSVAAKGCEGSDEGAEGAGRAAGSDERFGRTDFASPALTRATASRCSSTGILVRATSSFFFLCSGVSCSMLRTSGSSSPILTSCATAARERPVRCAVSARKARAIASGSASLAAFFFGRGLEGGSAASAAAARSSW